MAFQSEPDLSFSKKPNEVPSSPAPKAGAREWMGLALLALPTILLGLDLTLLHLMLPALAADLQPTSTQALWIMDAYGFLIAGFLITMGTLGDRIGRRKLLMIGAAAFAVASTLAAFSTSAVMLIAARALLGMAGATLMPSTLALITNMFVDPKQRALGFGIWATTFALGMALGPVVGGALLERFWWGAAFLIAVPLVVLLVLLAPVLLPEYRAAHAGRLDLASVGLSLAAMLPVVYGIKQIAKDDFGFQPIGALALGLVFATLFVRRQRRLADPLLDVALFANRAFSVALVVLLFGLVAVGGTMLLVTQYLQLVAGFSPLVAGLWMGPPALAMVAAGVTAPLISRHIRPGFVVAGALGLSVTGYVMLALLDSSASGTAVVVTGFSLAYFGLGTIAALGTDLVVGSAPADKAGSASAMSETVQDLGISLGIAILGSLSTAVYRQTMHSHMPEGLGPRVREAVKESLWSATSVASQLPPGLLETAREAFIAGFSSAAMFSAASVAILAVLAGVSLRRIDVIKGGK
ncbi:MFS transporter [Bosea sp. ANAM02]|uniref:MFS transporter n=1 Tax=Bosea sp. ANAM02 TaxID=2020412 RepID=UPI001566E6B3|nr:MFS transporter [Bosea sp. ANAM02]